MWIWNTHVHPMVSINAPVFTPFPREQCKEGSIHPRLVWYDHESGFIDGLHLSDDPVFHRVEGRLDAVLVGLVEEVFVPHLASMAGSFVDDVAFDDVDVL